MKCSPMTEVELAKFLGIEGHPKARALIANLSPERRALFEKMRAVELWDAGFGEKPTGVLYDFAKPERRAEPA